MTHYLKLGTSRELLEKERLQHENELLKARTAQIAAGGRAEELLGQALQAFGTYRGETVEDDPFED